jgi:hypothetical protein
MVLTVCCESKYILEVSSVLKFLEIPSELLSFGSFSFQSILVLDGALAEVFVQALTCFRVRIDEDFVDIDAERTEFFFARSCGG